MRSSGQTVATYGKGFGLFSRLRRRNRFATGCQRPQPRGSIKAPSFVVLTGYAAGPVAGEPASPCLFCAARAAGNSAQNPNTVNHDLTLCELTRAKLIVTLDATSNRVVVRFG